jgi:hypothetical protein
MSHEYYLVGEVDVDVDGDGSIYHLRMAVDNLSYKVVKLERPSSSSPYTVAWGKHIYNPSHSNMMFIPSKIMINENINSVMLGGFLFE